MDHGARRWWAGGDDGGRAGRAAGRRCRKRRFQAGRSRVRAVHRLDPPGADGLDPAEAAGGHKDQCGLLDRLQDNDGVDHQPDPGLLGHHSDSERFGHAAPHQDHSHTRRRGGLHLGGSRLRRSRREFRHVPVRRQRRRRHHVLPSGSQPDKPAAASGPGPGRWSPRVLGRYRDTEGQRAGRRLPRRRSRRRSATSPTARSAEPPVRLRHGARTQPSTPTRSPYAAPAAPRQGTACSTAPRPVVA